MMLSAAELPATGHNRAPSAATMPAFGHTRSECAAVLFGRMNALSQNGLSMEWAAALCARIDGYRRGECDIDAVVLTALLYIHDSGRVLPAEVHVPLRALIGAAARYMTGPQEAPPDFAVVQAPLQALRAALECESSGLWN